MRWKVGVAQHCIVVLQLYVIWDLGAPEKAQMMIGETKLGEEE